jgi:V8-like Glu-specific endopeptidase
MKKTAPRIVQIQFEQLAQTEARISALFEKAVPLPTPILKRLPKGWVTRDFPEDTFEGIYPESDDVSTLAASTKRVDDLSEAPYRSVGRLTFRFGRKSYFGSAWVVGERLIATAAHCVFDKDKGGVARDVFFSPQFSSESNLGRWRVESGRILRGWQLYRDFRYDMAVCVLEEPITDVTGSLGYRIRFDDRLRIRAIGYPGKPNGRYEFDGRTMWKSQGRVYKALRVRKMESHLTPGCSGGPWTIPAVEPQSYLTNGLNSFHLKDEPGWMFSPFLDEDFRRLVRNRA